MSGLKIGDVCIGQNHILDLHLNGMECVVTEPLEFVTAFNSLGEIVRDRAYGVRWADGTDAYAAPQYLRKRRPPSTDESESRQAMLDCIERARRPVGVPA